jgi:hypothetical protein
VVVRQFPGPFVADARYEALTGGLERRQIAYLMKSKLGYEPEEVSAMPWHRLRMWLEGITWDFSGFKEQSPSGWEDDDLAAMGFTVRKVEA